MSMAAGFKTKDTGPRRVRLCLACAKLAEQPDHISLGKWFGWRVEKCAHCRSPVDEGVVVQLPRQAAK